MDSEGAPSPVKERVQKDRVLGAPRQRANVLANVCGQIKLSGTPYYGLVLEVGSSRTPLVPVDTARHLVHWISSVGRKVLIRQLLAVSEEFMISTQRGPIEYKNYVVRWEDVETLEENEDPKSGRINFTGSEEADDIIKSERTCRIIVHHVSIPFYVNDKCTSGTCLVLISYDNRNRNENKLWLILTAEQVAFKEFLIPNREYLCYYPEGTDRFYFDESQKPLDMIMKNNIIELKVIFHHKILFSKYGILGSVLPEGCKLYLSGNTNLSECVYRFTADSLWFRFWFSTSEADRASVPLVTFYGRIIEIWYDKEKVFQSCYLCHRTPPNKPELQTPNSSVPRVWMDPFKSSLELGHNQLVELPNVCDSGDGRMPTGVPAGLVQVMKLQDLVTGEERCVYVKHSFVSSCQQMARLTQGLTVCLTHLNRRCSANGNIYYITTMLTCYRVLDCPSPGESHSERLGLHGLCENKDKPHMKSWGVLEPFNVFKVVIRAECKTCGSLFEKKCSGHCTGMVPRTISAHAVARISIIHYDKSVTMEKVMIKDDFVRTVLGIPEKIWKILEDAAAEEEIVALRDQVLDESPETSRLRRLYNIFFKERKVEKYNISVEKQSQNGEEDLYYCLNLEPMNKDGLSDVS